MKTLWGFVPLLILAALCLVAWDTAEFEEPVYEPACNETFDVRVFYFGPHICSVWIWFEYNDGMNVDWQNIVPGSGWHTNWNGDYNVTIQFIGPGPGAFCDNRLIVWFHDWEFGLDGDKPVFIVEGITLDGDPCYDGQIAAMLDERQTAYHTPLHDILTFGHVRGEPTTGVEHTWGRVKALYR